MVFEKKTSRPNGVNFFSSQNDLKGSEPQKGEKNTKLPGGGTLQQTTVV